MNFHLPLIQRSKCCNAFAYARQIAKQRAGATLQHYACCARHHTRIGAFQTGDRLQLTDKPTPEVVTALTHDGFSRLPLMLAMT